jgi:hypothetical protein
LQKHQPIIQTHNTTKLWSKPFALLFAHAQREKTMKLSNYGKNMMLNLTWMQTEFLKHQKTTNKIQTQ